MRIFHFLTAVAAESPGQSCGFTVPCLTLSVGRLTSKNKERNVPLCRNPLSESVPVMDRTPRTPTPSQLQEAGSSHGLKVNVFVAQREKKKLDAQAGDENRETRTITGSTPIDGSWFLAVPRSKFSGSPIIDE